MLGKIRHLIEKRKASTKLYVCDRCGTQNRSSHMYVELRVEQGGGMTPVPVCVDTKYCRSKCNYKVPKICGFCGNDNPNALDTVKNNDGTDYLYFCKSRPFCCNNG